MTPDYQGFAKVLSANGLARFQVYPHACVGKAKRFFHSILNATKYG